MLIPHSSNSIKIVEYLENLVQFQNDSDSVIVGIEWVLAVWRSYVLGSLFYRIFNKNVKILETTITMIVVGNINNNTNKKKQHVSYKSEWLFLLCDYIVLTNRKIIPSMSQQNIVKAWHRKFRFVSSATKLLPPHQSITTEQNSFYFYNT